MPHEILPQFQLMMTLLVEIGGNTIGVGEQRTAPPGPDDPETLRTSAEPRLEVPAR